MRAVLFIICLLCFSAAGCRPAQPLEHKDKLNPDELSVVQADSRLAESMPVDGSQSVTVALEAPTKVLEEKTGTRAPDIKKIQQALKNLDLYKGKIDGKMGSGTRRAIKEFQASNGLAEDGKVGPKTWGLLKEAVDL